MRGLIQRPNTDWLSNFFSDFDQFDSTGPWNLEGNTYVAYFDVPGFRKDDIELTLDQEYLKLSGMSERHGYTRRLSKTVTIPQKIDVDNITATVADGILEVRLPKSEKDLRTIKVN